MQRVAAAIVVLLVVFGSGVLTGSWLATPGDDDIAIDPDAAATARGSQAQPIPTGEEAELGPWVLRVDDVDPRAGHRVLDANQFNTAAVAGTSFMLVDVTIRRRASGPGVLRGNLVPALVTPTGREYPLTTECGVLPRPVDVLQPLGAGQSLEGQWCWAVREPDVPKVALRIGGTASGAVWFALV